MRVAIIHPWLLAFGGAEQTMLALADIFPEADIFLFLAEGPHVSERLKNRNVSVVGPNWLPLKYKIYRYLLPFYPSWSETLDLRGYDLILSSDSALTKGVLTDQSAVHLCYCHSPMRCLYDQYWQYLMSMPWGGRWFFRIVAHYCRMWDFTAAQRVDVLIANSKNVAQRIQTYYGRDSETIYPPVQTRRGYIHSDVGDYYLTAGRLTDTKRVDLLIEACNRLGRKLIVVGSGRDEGRLRALAGSTIVFPGHVSDKVLSDLYARCRAFLFAADEDFGIVPVEAQSYGRPVIAYGSGGSLETVKENITGVYFKDQTADSVAEAILHFESIESNFDPYTIQQHAGTFDIDIFKEQIKSLAKRELNSKKLKSRDGYSRQVPPSLEFNNPETTPVAADTLF